MQGTNPPSEWITSTKLADFFESFSKMSSGRASIRLASNIDPVVNRIPAGSKPKQVIN